MGCWLFDYRKTLKMKNKCVITNKYNYEVLYRHSLLNL